MDIATLYKTYLRHPQVTTDSRHCPPGSLFFALKGERFDGNRFAKQALDGGASYAVVDDPAAVNGKRTLLVADVLQSLQALARYHRLRLGTPIIGITGTNGKTTTKELLACVLASQYKLLATEGNLNNQIGVPLTLLRLRPEHELAVIEMGASHPGDIRELVDIARPDYGLITNIGHAHLEGFGSFEGVVRTKGELYDYLRDNHGLIFIHKEDENLQSIAKGLEEITYGSIPGCFVEGHALADGSPFLAFDWQQTQGNLHKVHTHLIGDYNLPNALAAIAAARYFHIPPVLIDSALAAYEPSNNRSQWVETKRNRLVVDAYNANPDSMKAALENFRRMEASPKVAILGDMKELGGDSGTLHEEVLQLALDYRFDKLYLCGKNFAGAEERLAAAKESGTDIFTCPTTEALTAELQSRPPENCLVLVKGSHSMNLETLIPFL